MAADRKYRDSPFAPAADEPLLARVIPLTKRLSGYRADAGRRDLLAGLTVAALALPSGMAYAELAGSPRLGRYADISVHREAKVTPGSSSIALDYRLCHANADNVKGRVNGRSARTGMTAGGGA